MHFFLCGFALIVMAWFGPVPADAAEKLRSIEVVPNLPKSTVSLAMSPDGTLLASGEYDGSIQLWDFRSGRLLRTLSRHRQEVVSVKFVADGKQVISASKDLTVKLWDAATGQLLRTSELISPAAYTWDIKLSSDGSQVASAQDIKAGDRAGVIKLWDTATGRLIRSFRASALALAFTADGKQIAAGGNAMDYKPGGQITLWDVTSGRLLRTFEQKGLSTVYKIAISPDGTRILSASSESGATAVVWDASTGRSLHSFAFKEFVETVALSSDGGLAMTGDRTNEVRIWDVKTGKLVNSVNRDQMASAAAFLPDGLHLLVRSSRLELLDVKNGSSEKLFGSERFGLSESRFTANGSEIITGGKLVRRWSARDGQLLSTLIDAPADKAYSVALAEDASRVIWEMDDHKTLKIANVKSGNVLSTLSHANVVTQAKLSPDGRQVLSAAYKAEMILWDVESGQALRIFKQPGDTYSVAFSPDGSRVSSGGNDGSIRLWDKSNGQLLWTYKDVGPTSAIVWSLTFSSDGSRVLVAISDRAPKLLDAATGRLIRAFDGHKLGYIVSVAELSPDGSLVITASHDETAKLWDVVSGRLVHTFEIGSVSHVAFSPDGKRALLDNSLWDIDTRQRLATIISSSESEWLVITPEGYFAASDQGYGILSVVRGFEIWSIDQFYQSLYRPDLLREKLAGDPRGLVREAAANLDLNKAISSGSAPDVRLTLPGRALGSGKIDGTSVSAEAEITDLGGGIGRVEWRVNGVTASVDTPAAASGGMPVMLTRSLSLDPGDNTIEVVAYNGANLIASVPARLSVATQIASPSIVPSQPVVPSTTPAPAPVAAARSRLFVLVAGVNEYADKRFTLSYAVSDAKDIARGFQEASGGIYQSAEVKLMTDAEVTRDKLDAAFAEIAGQVSAADVFVLYLAGHGKTVDGRYYFVPQDFAMEGELSDKAINAAVKSKAIAQEQWQRWFATIPARKSVILFDTCDSGTLAGDETQQLEKGAANSRLSQATGRSILTASGGSQEALEGYHGHGLFTYEILDAINQADGDRNGTVELNELAAYVYAQVSELSEKVFKQRQVPEMKITANFPLARQTRILQDETTPVAEAKPTYQMAQTAQLQVQPNSGATVVRSLSAKTPVTVLESKNGWSLVASEGKPIGYVATRDLAPVQ